MSEQFKPSVIAELKPYNGVTTIFVNGMPQSGLVYMTYWPKAQTLPIPADVYDLFNDTWLAHNAASFEIDLPSTRTGLYYVGKEAEM